MAEEVLIEEVTEKMLHCPFCRIETVHIYEGKTRFYSRWRCRICGRVIVGEPIQRVKTPPFYFS